MSKKNCSVSVTWATGERIDEHCKRTRGSQAELIDKAILPVLDGTAPIPPALLKRSETTGGKRASPTPPRRVKAAKPEPVERVHPPSAFCASCLRDIGGHPYREAPIGKNDAMVALCSQCDTERVRERDSLFGGSSGRSTGIGTGNRHRATRL